MAKQVKWTQELRKIMYDRLVREFGDHSQWGMSEYPKGKKTQYDRAVKEIASCLECITGQSFAPSAVEQQVAWGFTKQRTKRPCAIRGHSFIASTRHNDGSEFGGRGFDDV